MVTSALAQKESIPYYNPGEDISTVTTVLDATYTDKCTAWSVYTIGMGNQANKAFSYVPGYRGNYDWTAGGTLWTKALDIKDGYAYKVTVVMGSTFNGYNYDLVRPYTQHNIALYASPDRNASQTEIYKEKGVGPFDTSNRPTYTAYFKGDSSKPYLGFGNRGGGNVSRFNIDDIRVVEVDKLTPLPISGLSASPEGKSVSIQFTLPTKSVIDEDLSSIATVRLWRDGIVIKEWKNQNSGGTIDYTDNLNSAATYTYTVDCGNNNSFSEKTSVSVTVPVMEGFQTPTINSEYGKDDNKHSGYYGRQNLAYAIYVPGEGIKVKYSYPLYQYKVDEIPEGEDITYGTVTRVNDGKKLVESSTLNEIPDNDLDETLRNSYQYKVDLKRGEYETTAYSSILSINNPMPFFPGMGKPALDEFTYYDTDGDMSSWSYANGNNSSSRPYRDVNDYFSCSNNVTSSEGEDWLISPGLLVEKGKTYRVDIDAFSGTIIEKLVQFSVAAGKSNTVEAMTDVIIPLTKLKHQAPQTYSAYYTPDFSGNIFFGIQSYYGQAALGISRIEIYEVSNEIPVAIDLINVKYSTTPGEATISFNAPSKNIVGGDLSSLEKIELYRNGELIETIQAPKPGELISRDITFAIGSQDEYMTIPYSSGGKGLSTRVQVMILETPYSNEFNNESDLIGFTIVDPDDGEYTWGYLATQKAMRCYPEKSGHNDYLFLPPIHFEKDQFYKFDFSTWLSTADVDKLKNNQIEVVLASAPSVDKIIKTVLEPNGVFGSMTSKKTVKTWFNVPETGEYYLALHSIAEPGNGVELFVDDLNIGEKIPGTYPGPVTDLRVVPNRNGEASVTISYNIPTNNLLGNPLSANIRKVVLYRDGKEILTQSNQAPGTSAAYTDTKVPTGIHTYTVTCFGYDTQTGETPTIDMDKEVFVGINKPGESPSVTAVQNPDNIGEVIITWEAPEADADGFPLNTTDIKYQIGRYVTNNMTGEIIPEYYSTNFTPGQDGKLELRTMACDENLTQEFMRFFVLPYTSAGSANHITLSRYVAIGKPFTLPYKESFKNSISEHSMLQDYPWPAYTMASWGFGTENPTTGVKPVDGDRGLLVMQVEWSEQGARLYTPQITLDVEKPFMTFYIYNQSLNGRLDNNEFGVTVKEGNGEFITVKRMTVDEWAEGHPGWQKASVDLSEYAGHTVHIGLEGRAYNMTFIHIDNILIDNQADTDISLKHLTTDRVFVGLPHNITAYLKNHGAKEIKDATVTLRMDGKSIETKTIETIAPGEKSMVIFTNTLDRNAVGNHHYMAVLKADGDKDNLDNSTDLVYFSMLDNEYPTVENLDGNYDGTNINLTWDAPVLPSEPVEITDDFERYPSWSTMYTGIGDYTLIDADNKGVSVFSDVTLPNIQQGSRQSFTLWDFSLSDFQFSGSPYKAHSGDKCLVSIYNVVDGSLAYTDDRLISPLLTGEAQTISFWAKAITDAYPDVFKVYYSKSGIDFSDFEKNVFEADTVEGTWTKFTYDLPEGTKYFMIRHHCGYGRFFMVDDLTYKPVGEEALQLQGYNIYEGNDKLNEEPIKTTSFSSAKKPADLSNLYAVSAVYDRGESPSVTTMIANTNVANNFTEGVSVTAENHQIVIKGASGRLVEISNMSGLLITRRIADDVTYIPVSQGIYIVKVDNKSFKLKVN